MDKMPEFKPSNMDERVKRALAVKGRTHFSRTDWDFEDANWTLDEIIYKAAPPSLHGTNAGAALVKHATTGALSDGRLITWTRASIITILINVFFRNQAADGTANFLNTYFTQLEETELKFYKRVAAGTTLLDTHAFTWNWAINTWYKLRHTWWSSVDRIYLRVERWNGDSWETLGGAADTDFEDTDDLWKDAAVNRTGVFYYDSRWIDDVEVWGR